MSRGQNQIHTENDNCLFQNTPLRGQFWGVAKAKAKVNGVNNE